MKRSMISLVLVLCLLCGFLAFGVSAAEILASGKLSLTDIEWTLDDTGLLYLSGTGPMTACDEDVNTGWKDYVYDITAGYIEDGITDIGVYCFDRCLSMKTVYMPDSITMIESHAFEWCRGLTGITLPANLEVIGNQTFYNCDGLETIEFNGKLTYIGYSAFNMCRSLTAITLPASLEEIGSYAFQACDNLESVTFLGDAPKFGGGVFSGAGWLNGVTCYYPEGNPTWTEEVMKSVGGSVKWVAYTPEGGDDETEVPVVASGACGDNATWTLNEEGLLTVSGTGPMAEYTHKEIPWKDVKNDVKFVVVEEGITSIGLYGFSFCPYLTEVTLPSTVESIGEKAFYTSPRISFYSVAEDNPRYSSIDGVLFNKEQTELLKVPADFQGAYSIPEGVTAIAPSAFYDCRDLTEVTVPEGVTTVGDGAFYCCQSLSSVTLPESLTVIDADAFMLCYSLRELTVPAAVTAIGRWAFYDSNLEEIWFRGEKPELGENAFGCLQLDVYYPGQYESWNDQGLYGANSICYIPYQLQTPGDLNGDGGVNDADVALLLWHTLFPDAYEISGNADFNGDGVVNDADVAYLLWHTLFPEQYPINGIL